MSGINKNQFKSSLSAGLVIILSFLVSGCASTRYEWKGYDRTLYKHYKDPAHSEVFLEEIKEIVDYAETKKKVPPGMYAEYGYLLYEAHKYKEAIVYFKKEKELWPESQMLMDKMIINTDKLVKK